MSASLNEIKYNLITAVKAAEEYKQKEILSSSLRPWSEQTALNKVLFHTSEAVCVIQKLITEEELKNLESKKFSETIKNRMVQSHTLANTGYKFKPQSLTDPITKLVIKPPSLNTGDRFNPWGLPEPIVKDQPPSLAPDSGRSDNSLRMNLLKDYFRFFKSESLRVSGVYHPGVILSSYVLKDFLPPCTDLTIKANQGKSAKEVAVSRMAVKLEVEFPYLESVLFHSKPLDLYFARKLEWLLEEVTGITAADWMALQAAFESSTKPCGYSSEPYRKMNNS